MGQLRQFAKSIPGLRPVVVGLKRTWHATTSFRSPYVRMFPAGNFYSPLPDIKQVGAEQGSLFNANVRECPGVDVGEARQLAVLDELAKFYPDVPFQDK